MKSIFFVIFVWLLAVSLAADDRVDQIYLSFQYGDVERAKQLFDQLPPTTTRDGNRIFLSALFEPDGKEVRNLLKAALQAGLDDKYRAEAAFRLVLLADAGGGNEETILQAKDFLGRWRADCHRGQILALLATHTTGEERDRFLDLLTKDSAVYYSRYARIIMANDAFKKGHYKTASSLCRQITKSSDNGLTPIALMMLSRIAIKNNDAEQALLNYNMLNEGFPHAIGGEDLVEALKQVSEKKQDVEPTVTTVTTPKTSYTIQIGVFSIKGNADKMAARIKAYGYSTVIKKQILSNKTYYVVRAGKFASLREAQTAKKKLEQGEREVFKVVVDDEK